MANHSERLLLVLYRDKGPSSSTQQPSQDIAHPSIMSVHRSASTIMYLVPQRTDSRCKLLDSHRSFNSINYCSQDFAHFDPVRILDEDRVSPHSGVPTHRHRDAAVSSYSLLKFGTPRLHYADSWEPESGYGYIPEEERRRPIYRRWQWRRALGPERAQTSVELVLQLWENSLHPVYHHGIFRRERRGTGCGDRQSSERRERGVE